MLKKIGLFVVLFTGVFLLGACGENPDDAEVHRFTTGKGMVPSKEVLARYNARISDRKANGPPLAEKILGPAALIGGIVLLCLFVGWIFSQRREADERMALHHKACSGCSYCWVEKVPSSGEPPSRGSPSSPSVVHHYHHYDRGFGSREPLNRWGELKDQSDGGGEGSDGL